MDERLSQVILDFEAAAVPEGPIRLCVYASERDYFNDLRREPPAKSARLSKLFQETLLQDAAGWRRRIWSADRALEIGRQMWSSLPERVCGPSSAPRATRRGAWP